MKSFSILKLAMGLGALTALTVLAPASRAQSEVAPDHFDGTDSWAAAAAGPVRAPKIYAANAQPASSSAEASSKKSTAPSMQPVAARSAVSTRRSEPKRKPANPASN